MKRNIVWTTQFKKDYKLAIKRGYDISLLDDCIRKLSFGEELAPKFHDHMLAGRWSGTKNATLNPIGY